MQTDRPHSNSIYHACIQYHLIKAGKMTSTKKQTWQNSSSLSLSTNRTNPASEHVCFSS